MRIAVLSGKGGTGKTFVSVNFAYAAKECIYADCDVEEPNGALFLQPEIEREENVKVSVPFVEAEKCSGCRKCIDFCKYNALSYVKDQLLIFPELCHSCGGCMLLCPENALKEKQREIGQVEYGKAGSIKTCAGRLYPGEATGIPLIRKLLQDLTEQETIVVDCPPGSSCAVMESIQDSSFCVLVAEPTLFGVHNLAMVYELVKLFNKPHGVILNKTVEGETIAEDYCQEKGLPILMRIPYDSEIGLLNSRGIIVAAAKTNYLNLFQEVLHKIREEVQHEAVGSTKR